MEFNEWQYYRISVVMRLVFLIYSEKVLLFIIVLFDVILGGKLKGRWHLDIWTARLQELCRPPSLTELLLVDPFTSPLNLSQLGQSRFRPLSQFGRREWNNVLTNLMDCENCLKLVHFWYSVERTSTFASHSLYHTAVELKFDIEQKTVLAL